MSNPIATFSGLASGIQWRDLVDQIMEAEKARTLTPLQSQVTLQGQRRTAWQSFEGLVDKLRTATTSLRLGTAFAGFDVAVGGSASSGRALLSATAGAAARPGSYDVEVLSLARPEKLTGTVVASATGALGITGDIALNGVTVSIAASDSLNAVRDKINAANTGAAPSKVSASVLSTGSGSHRLVLTADQAGSAGIALGEGAGGALRELGFLDTRSRAVSSVTSSIAAALGVMMPPPTAIRVSGRTITVDLSTDSLATIAARIRAAGVDAQVVAEARGDGVAYRLVVDGNVQAEDGDANGAAVVDALGLAAGERASVRQTVSTPAYTSGGAPVTAGTALTALELDGATVGLVAGDAINVRGTRGDGSAVTIGVTVQGGDTVQTLLDRINDATGGFGAGARPASAVLGDDGRIRLTDGMGGESQLSLTLAVSKDDGSAASLGAASVTTTGRQREVVNGTDALVRVDGVLVTSASNSISGAITGLTLELQQAEVGTTVAVTVGRDEKAATTAVKALVDAYNAIVDFADKQAKSGQPLDNNSVLRSVLRSFTSALRTPGTGAYASAATAGVALDRNGKLQLDEAAFTAAFQENRADLAALFGAAGVAGKLDVAAVFATRIGDGTVDRQLQALDRSRTSLERRIDSAEQRLVERRESLLRQFTRMEEGLSRMQAQGSYLQSQLAALQPSRQ